MKNYSIILISLALAAASAPAAAQNLQTEITVDRTVQPDLREADRPAGVTPSLTLPPISVNPLQAAEYSGAGVVTNISGNLPPAAWSDSVAYSPYIGYVSAGYFPMYNASGSGGLQLIRKPKTKLNLWAQADGYSYKGDIPYYPQARLGNLIAVGGADFLTRLSDGSVITLDGKLMGALVRKPFSYLSGLIQTRSVYNQYAYSVDVNARWEKRFDNITTSFGAGWERFDFVHQPPKEVYSGNSTVCENSAKINASIGLIDEYTDVSWMGIDVDWDILSSNLYPYTWLYGKRTVSEGSVKPFINFESANVKGRIGANFSVATGNREDGLKVAPEAFLEYDVFRTFVLWARATGGEYLNPVAKMFQINPYLIPYKGLCRSNVPYALSGGFSYGPSSGVCLEVKGGYAKATNMLIPLVTIDNTGYMQSTFIPSNFKSWYVGAKLAYSYSDIASASVEVCTAGSDSPFSTWYEWHDGAKLVVDARLQVRPISRLKVGLQYLMRTERKGVSEIYPYGSTSFEASIGVPNFGRLGNLNASAAYTLSDRLTLTCSLENILSESYLLINGIQAQKIHGLIGATYKF